MTPMSHELEACHCPSCADERLDAAAERAIEAAIEERAAEEIARIVRRYDEIAARVRGLTT